MLVERQMDSSVPKREGSPCQQGGDSQAAKVTRHSIPELPEVCCLKILMMMGINDTVEENFFIHC